MNQKLFLICVVIGVIHRSQSACLCGFGEGIDGCADGTTSGTGIPCSPMVVRPAPLPRIPFITGTAGPSSKPRIVCKEVIDGLHPSGLRPLRPIGDLCSCRQTIVVPANVPRPACKKCGGSSTIYEPVQAVRGPEPEVYPVPTGTGGHGIPVDPVSLGIVYAQSQKSCGRFADDRIFYGSRVLPRDEPILKPVKSKLPEKSLYQIKGVPIELMPIPCRRQVSRSDEEALEDLLMESELIEEQAQEARQIPQFTYDDLGFSVVTPDQPQFIAVQGTAPEEDTPDDVVIDDIGDFTGGTFQCKDGYRPGNVIIKSIPQRDVYVPRPTIPISCPGEEGDDTLYPIITDPYPGFPVYPGHPGTGVVYEPYPCDS